MTTVYDFSATRLDGSEQSLADYRGQVLLIVNTASECGFTPQYAGLESLYGQYRDQGFSVLGFPCNQFGGQEPEGEAGIARFCQLNYGVDFLLSEKVDVNGPHAHPLFRYLTSALPGVLGTQPVKWNFTKFLIDKAGVPVRRYAPTTSPADLADDIEALL